VWGKPVATHELHRRVEPRHLSDAELIALAASAVATSGDEGDVEQPLH